MLGSTAAMVTRRPATYADLERLPAHRVGELIDGVLYDSPRPRARHALAAGDAFVDLKGPFDRGRGGPGGWYLLPEPELRLGSAFVDDEPVRAEPFDAVELSMTPWWLPADQPR
jgi:hypothetical protein